ncbi:epimerase [Sphingobacterium faecium NBRC 15299]|jgi:nucleoside-diphosphate-sugar epimerase|uniref:NAD-dependent epimerase/dehydratase family protein n=1 Tax=Sphingobacterium faecium TaxID=34087 RepID=UPI000D3ABF48|nr:NAD-dependent epimerase/dehydratase family protein [Sphingobacterium faecium]PTX12517.1 UDP-glucose 4-epimerase [Sphingobacterium faecium]GEM62226.1 epimerase [Sphingobacterium faecium NBRC 15299]
MTKILITGGAGNLGSSLVHTLVQRQNYEVVVVDNLTTGNKANLPQGYPNLKFFKCDVNIYSELAAIMQAFQFDYVLHYAAVVGVKRTLENPLAVLQDIEGIKNILNLSRDLGVKRVFYASSSEVYGESTQLPQKEDITPLNCKLPYAIVKNVGEAFFRSYQKEYGLPFGIFRFFNTYGPKQSSDFVIPRFIESAMNNQDITIYGNGHQTRTFCYVDDNVETVFKIIDRQLLVNEIINIGCSIEINIRDLAEKIIALTNSSSSIIHLPALKEGDMSRRQPDNAKMLGILGKQPVSVENGIKNIISLRYSS